MPIKTGSTLYGLDGSAYRLDQEIGKGGQGTVWALAGEPSLVAKVYHNAIPPGDLPKLETMCRLKGDALTRVAAWPLKLLRETRVGNPQGILMPRVTGFHSVNQLYGIKSRLRVYPQAQFPFLLHAAINTARAFSTIHEAGQVVGDVNHSNLMISQNATAAIIDCDSFQITDGSTVFACPVGVPEFTPPEIQGASFATLRRTKQHDAFGLSVLIFYLLFLGRHPFMGIYDPKQDEIIASERAIAEYKFPYALKEPSAEVRLPPFVPRLTDYPANVGDLFKRAFTREAVSRGRPTAQEWIAVLTSLASSTKQCSANPNHHHFYGLVSCPWCRVEGVIGTPIFGVRIIEFRDDRFDLSAVWAQIEAVVPTLEPLSLPDLKQLQMQFSPDDAIPGIVRGRRVFRIWSVVIVLGASLWATAELTAFPAVLAILGALVIGASLWGKGRNLANGFFERAAIAARSYGEAKAALEQSAGVPSAFEAEKQRLRAIKNEYEDLASLKARRLRELEASRDRKQLQHFLEGFRLEDGRIPNIGDKNKLVLYTWGILDAWDIEESKVRQIKGFGPVKIQSLLKWREEKERQFRFDPRQPVDPRDLLALEQEIQQKSVSMQAALRSGPAVLRQNIGVWQARRRELLGRVFMAASQLSRAQVDLKALRGF